MNPTTDIIVTAGDVFDAILADVRNEIPLDVTRNGSVTIDDVVCIVSIHRDAIEDRSAWWKIRREAYAKFASHETIAARTLATIPDAIRDELASLDSRKVESIARRWIDFSDSTPTDHESARLALQQFVDICARARNSRASILLRTNQPANDFELAFKMTDGKRLKNFQKAFDSWDESKKHEAHQRYNFYVKQGDTDCLDRVLRDFSRPKTSRLNLKTDQRKVKKYIAKRVKSFIKSPLPDSGRSGDPLTMVSLEFDLEYEGCVDLVFTTRPDAVDAFEFVEDTGDRLELNHWREAAERLGCENLPLQLTLLDGQKVIIEPKSADEQLDTYIGDMLRETLMETRAEKAFSKLPVSGGCVFCVGGVHTDYFWSSHDKLID